MVHPIWSDTHVACVHRISFQDLLGQGAEPIQLWVHTLNIFLPAYMHGTRSDRWKESAELQFFFNLVPSSEETSVWPPSVVYTLFFAESTLPGHTGVTSSVWAVIHVWCKSIKEDIVYQTISLMSNVLCFLSFSTMQMHAQACICWLKYTTQMLMQ